MVNVMVTVASGSKEMGVLGLTFTIAYPSVDIRIEVISSA